MCLDYGNQLDPPMKAILSLGLHHIFALLTISMSGCGIMGYTTRTVIDLETLPKIAQMRPTSLASITRNEQGEHLTTVGRVHAWGAFDDNDQSNIAASIEDALAAAVREKQVTVDEPIRVHVLIREYLLRMSTHFVAIVSGVDWAVVNSSNEILFQDTFYATSYCETPAICAVGYEKDKVNHAIVERIAKRAILLAMGMDPTPIVPDRTYSTFKEADATVRFSPRSLVTDFLFGRRPGSESEHMFWVESAELKTPTDWALRLRVR